MEETEDPRFYVDFDIDMELWEDEENLVAPSKSILVATSNKWKQPMEGVSCGARPTHASIRSTSIFIGGSVTTQVVDAVEASSYSD